jgi:hypothetical protein
VNLAPVRQLHAVQAIEAREERVRVGLEVHVVVLQDREQELVLAVPDRLDDEAVVARKVEERARLARRAELGQDVLGGEREQVVGRIEAEELADVAEDPGRVVLELEVVLGRRRELVADDVERELVPRLVVGVAQRARELGLAA